MATVLMKILERWPATYQRGIAGLTAGRLARLHRELAHHWVQPGDRVLDLGCGDGHLAEQCAARGARVVGLDASPAMLEEAQQRLQKAGLAGQVEWVQGDAADLADLLPGRQFDLVVASLVLSEMPGGAVERMLRAARAALAEGGRLVVIDEVVPEPHLVRWAYWLVRWPLSALTWLLTRSTTYPLAHAGDLLQQTGWEVAREERHLGGALTLILARPDGRTQDEALAQVPPLASPRPFWDSLKGLYCLLWRNIPPYPSVRPGLYRLGAPGPGSPVLVTGNYWLTVHRLGRRARGVDAWVLVADSSGVNVWCGAGGGHLTAREVAKVVHQTEVAQKTDHHRLILPQLCANGVRGEDVEKATGWQVQWGPVRARDIPAYLARGGQKTDAMRQVAFPLPTRLEMAVVMWQMWAVLLAIVLALIAPAFILPALACSLALFGFLGFTWPWWPVRDGLQQGVGLALLCLLGLGAAWLVHPDMSPRSVVQWAIGLVALALFVGADYQGAVPMMRAGEAEHFGRLIPVELGFLALYLVLQRLPLS